MSDHRIGITGTGETSDRNAVALVRNYLSARPEGEDVTFVIDATTDESGALSPASLAVTCWAVEAGFPIEVILPNDQKMTPGLGKLCAEATGQMLVVNVTATVVRRSDVVFIAWSEDPDDPCMKALLAAERHSVPAYDLTSGLLPLGFDDTPEPEQPGPPFVPDASPRPADSPSTERTILAPGTCTEGDSQDIVLPDLGDVDRLAVLVAERVVEALKPLLPAKRGPGRPRKTPIEE